MSLTLKSIRIHHFRNVKPGTTLQFSDKFNVFLGQNATGKTTLLELISCVLQGNYPFSSEKVELDFTFETAWGTVEGKVRPISRSEQDMAILDAQVRHSVPPYLAHYEDFEVTPTEGAPLRIYFESKSGTYDVEADFPLEPVELTGPRFGFDRGAIQSHLFKALNHDLKNPILQSFSQITTGTWGCRRFEEDLQWFSRLTGALPEPYQIRATFDKNNPGHSPRSMQISGFLPVTLLDLREKLSLDSIERFSELRLTRDELPYLRKFEELAGFRDSRLSYKILERTGGTEPTVFFGNPNFTFYREDDSSISHELLSYGQKRLFAFVSYLENCPKFAIADELVNGLHHEWIDFCMEELETRQSFLASQNPLLLDYLYFSSQEELAASFVQCRIESKDGQRWLVWEQMSEPQAKRFYDAYLVGIQHVSELLKSEQLW